MGYWWVNHKKTFKHEINGGYLWSPQRTKRGHRNPFWETMLEAVPGDGIVSHADGQIRHVGTVTGRAFNSRRPDEFGSAGEQWNKVGWRLPVEWSPLAEPLRPGDHLREIRDNLPSKYSPFNERTGGANQVYLAAISEDLFRTLVRLGHAREVWATTRRIPDRVREDQAPLVGDPISSEVERKVKIRIGQGVFRVRIRAFERSCRLTNIKNPRLLVASHIKPWRHCETTEERLDGANGLLLSPSVDRLFDRGLISFEDNGRIKRSPQLSSEDIKLLGLTKTMRRNSGRFHPRQIPYLSYHREKVFLKD